MNNKTFVCSVLVLGIGLVCLAGVASVMGNNVIESDIVKETNQNTYDTGTSVKWHGTLDLFIIDGDTGEREQVIYGEPNLITDIGANRIRSLLDGSLSTTDAIANLSLSNDAGAASAAWTILPSEITTNGLDRATASAGVVTNGTGKFNITHTWTATDTQSCQLIGTHWVATDNNDNNLFSALKFTQQNLLVNDQLEAIYSVEIS